MEVIYTNSFHNCIFDVGDLYRSCTFKVKLENKIILQRKKKICIASSFDLHAQVLTHITIHMIFAYNSLDHTFSIVLVDKTQANM